MDSYDQEQLKLRMVITENNILKDFRKTFLIFQELPSVTTVAYLLQNCADKVAEVLAKHENGSLSLLEFQARVEKLLPGFMSQDFVSQLREKYLDRYVTVSVQEFNTPEQYYRFAARVEYKSRQIGLFAQSIWSDILNRMIDLYGHPPIATDDDSDLSEDDIAQIRANPFKLRIKKKAFISRGSYPDWVYELFVEQMGVDEIDRAWGAIVAAPAAFAPICKENGCTVRELELMLRPMVSSRIVAMAKEAGQISDNGLEEPDLGKAFRWQDLEQAVLFVNIDYKLPDEIRPKKGQCVFLLRGYSDESGEHLGGSVVHKLDFPKQAFEKLNLSAYYREVGSSGSQIWLELPGQPAGTQVYAGYQYTQDQEGEIAITFASMNPMCDPYPPKIIRFQQG